jgi:hypothetical protein
MTDPIKEALEAAAGALRRKSNYSGSEEIANTAVLAFLKTLLEHERGRLNVVVSDAHYLNRATETFVRYSHLTSLISSIESEKV